MLPATHDISIYRGDTFALDFRLRSRSAIGAPRDHMDLTGASAAAQLKSIQGDVLATFTAEVADQSTDDGKGRVRLRLTPEVTAGLEATSALWDVQLTYADGTVRTYLKGKANIYEDVTS